MPVELTTENPPQPNCCGAAQLPLFVSSAPQSASVDFHAVSRPARTFTGDFYFTQRCGDRLWFVLGDVAGKGLPAAVVMEMIQEELERRFASCAKSDVHPATTVLRLQAFLRPLLPANRFVSAVVGQLHDDGTLVIANAGHCPPLIARRNGSIERIDSTGPVIGILSAASWISFSTKLDLEESLLVYSDGLPEARSADGCEYGIDRIERTLRAGRSRSARAITACVAEEAAAYAEDAREDDLTLIVLKRQRSGTERRRRVVPNGLPHDGVRVRDDAPARVRDTRRRPDHSNRQQRDCRDGRPRACGSSCSSRRRLKTASTFGGWLSLSFAVRNREVVKFGLPDIPVCNRGATFRLSRNGLRSF